MDCSELATASKGTSGSRVRAAITITTRSMRRIHAERDACISAKRVNTSKATALNTSTTNQKPRAPNPPSMPTPGHAYRWPLTVATNSDAMAR